MISPVPIVIKLANGAFMPSVGLGLWKIPKEKTAEVVYQALKKGYRCLDSACDYGNEKQAGEGIARAFKEGILERKDLFVTSKLWNTYHREEHAKQALTRTLEDLGLDYLDLYLIHFPISLAFVPFEKRYPPEWTHDPEDPKLNTLVMDNDAPLHKTWGALEAEVDAGRVRNIGVCNYPVALLMELLKYSRIKPSVLQVEMHPYLTQSKLLDFCTRNSIAVTAFSPLGAPSYVSLEMDQGLGKGALEEPIVKEIATRIGRTPAQVLLRFGLQRSVAVIPKTSKVERLDENLDLFDFELTQEDMEKIGSLKNNTRFNDPGEFCRGMGFSIPIYD